MDSLKMQHLFPQGKRKALVMSYDDGSEHDRRLVDIFNRYGIRGTFHLNSAKLGKAHHIGPQEVRSLYEGHEVSSHTVTHPYLTRLSEEAIKREVLDDRKALEDIAEEPVRGFAYPFGDYNERVVSVLSRLGLAYARTIDSTQPFRVTDDFLRWPTTCHHALAVEVGQQFLRSEDVGTKLMQVWGHSYELDGFMTADASKNWGYMQNFCCLMGGHDFIHYATIIEIVDYLCAMGRLNVSPDHLSVYNPSTLTLWIEWQGKPLALEPEAMTTLNR